MRGTLEIIMGVVVGLWLGTWTFNVERYLKRIATALERIEKDGN